MRARARAADDAFQERVELVASFVDREKVAALVAFLELSEYMDMGWLIASSRWPRAAEIALRNVHVGVVAAGQRLQFGCQNVHCPSVPVGVSAVTLVCMFSP